MSSHPEFQGFGGWNSPQLGCQPSPSQLEYPSAMMLQYCDSVMTEPIKEEPTRPQSRSDMNGLEYLKVSGAENDQSMGDASFLNSLKGSQAGFSCSDLTETIRSSSVSSPDTPRTPTDGEQNGEHGHIDEDAIGSPEEEQFGEDDHDKTATDQKTEKKKMKRFRLTHNQTRYLMSEFTRQAHPDAAHRERLSREIPGLSPRQVQVWFQNRRAKLKRLSLDDRERMLKSRALPDDFDISQSLHSPYGEIPHTYGSPLVSPGNFFPSDENDVYAAQAHMDHMGSTPGDEYSASPMSAASLYGGYFPGNRAPGFGTGQDSDVMASMGAASDGLVGFTNLAHAQTSAPGQSNFMPAQNGFAKQTGSLSRPAVSHLQLYNAVRARAPSLTSPINGNVQCTTPPLDYTETDSSVEMNSNYSGRSIDASVISSEGQGQNAERFQALKNAPGLAESQTKIEQGDTPPPLRSAPLPTSHEAQFSELGPRFNLNSFGVQGVSYPQPHNPSSNTSVPISHTGGFQQNQKHSEEVQGPYNHHGGTWLQQAIESRLARYSAPEFSTGQQ